MFRRRVAEREDFQLHDSGEFLKTALDLPVINGLREVIRATPFIPFTVTLSDGRRLRARTVNHVFLSPRGDTVYIYADDDHVVWVSTRHVTSIEPDQEAAVS